MHTTNARKIIRILIFSRDSCKAKLWIHQTVCTRYSYPVFPVAGKWWYHSESHRQVHQSQQGLVWHSRHNQNFSWQCPHGIGNREIFQHFPDQTKTSCVRLLCG